MTCSLHTKPCCAKSPTVWHHSTLCVYVLVGWHPGSTSTAVRPVATVVDWKVATDDLALLTIDVCGSTSYDKGCSCTVLRKKPTGSTAWSRTDAHHLSYGDHCQQYWVVTGTSWEPLGTLQMALPSSLPRRSMALEWQQLITHHRQLSKRREFYVVDVPTLHTSRRPPYYNGLTNEVLFIGPHADLCHSRSH